MHRLQQLPTARAVLTPPVLRASLAPLRRYMICEQTGKFLPVTWTDM